MSDSRIVHRHKQTSKLKLACGHILVPRISLWPINKWVSQLFRVWLLADCPGIWLPLGMFKHCMVFKLNFNIQCTDFNQVRPFDAYLDFSASYLAHKCTQLCTVIRFASNTTAMDGKYCLCLRTEIYLWKLLHKAARNTSLPPPCLHTRNNQILEVTKAWE